MAGDSNLAKFKQDKMHKENTSRIVQRHQTLLVVANESKNTKFFTRVILLPISKFIFNFYPPPANLLGCPLVSSSAQDSKAI